MSNRSRTDHSKKRRLLSPAFTKSKLEQVEITLIEKGIKPLIANFEKAASTKSLLDIFHQFHYMTWDITGEFAFGQAFQMLKDGVHPAVSWLESVTMFYTICYAFPFLCRFKIAAGEKMREFSMKILDKYYTQHELKKREAIENKTEPIITNLLGHFVDAVDKETGATLSRAEIFAEAHLMLFSGTDTTSNSLSFIFYMLIKHPHVYNRALEEVKNLKDVDIINYEMCRSLPYTEAVIKEVLRFLPAVPGCPIRIVPKGGVMLCGHFLPEGVEAATPIYAVHHSPWLWDSPDKFLPERWLDKSNSNFSQSMASFIPFSLGPRGCIGKDLAWMEMMLVTANILARFKLELDPEDSDLKLTALPILRPKNSRINVYVTSY